MSYLDDPIDARNVQTSRRHVRTAQNPLLLFTKLEKGRSPLLLFQLTVNLQNRQINVAEKVGVEFHGVAGGEEDHYLLVLVFAEEGVKEEEAFVATGGGGG